MVDELIWNRPCPAVEYFRMRDGYYKAAPIGRNEYRITWVEPDHDNGKFTVTSYCISREDYIQDFRLAKGIHVAVWKQMVSEINSVL